jgi:hypothetical protein
MRWNEHDIPRRRREGRRSVVLADIVGLMQQLGAIPSG